MSSSTVFYTVFLSLLVFLPPNGLQVFDAISYCCKGSAVVNMIYSVLGEAKFREGLQLYMKRCADLTKRLTKLSN